MKYRLFYCQLAFFICIFSPKTTSALTWDVDPSDGSTITSGSGTWNLDPANTVWNNNTGSVAWSNGTTAIFGGTAPSVGTTFDILLGANLSATTLTFNTNGYRLYADTPQTLTLTTATNTIRLNNGITALIDSNVTVHTNTSATAQLRGDGTLQLKGTLKIESTSYNFDMGGGITLEILEGGQWLSSNSIVIGGQTATGQTATVILNGGTIRTGAPGEGGVVGNNRNFLLSNADNTNATVTINSGELIVDAAASTGLRLGQGANTVAVLNLNGGKVFTPNLFGASGSNSTVNLNGGTIVANLDNTNFMRSLANAWVQAGGAIFDTNGFNITINQALKHDVALDLNPDGGLTKLGQGTLTLATNNTYTGATVIKEGTLSINSDAKLGAAPTEAIQNHLVIDGGTLQTTANVTLNVNRGVAIGSATGSGDGTFEVTGTTTLTYAGIIKNNGVGDDRLIKTGTGTLTLSGANEFSGGITVKEGRINFQSASNLGTDIDKAGYLVLDGGILRFSGGAHLPLDAGLTIGDNGATYEHNTNQNFRFTGKITGSGDFTFKKVGTSSGYIGITGTNDFTGKSILTTGTLVEIRSNQALGASGSDENGTLVEDNSTLRIDPSGSGGQSGTLTIAEWFTLNNGIILNNARNNTINGRLTLLNGGGTLASAGTTTLTYGGKITGNGNFNKSGSGTVTFTNSTNDYTGKTTVSEGTLQVGDGSTLGNSPWLEVHGGANIQFLATSYRLGGTPNPAAVSGNGTITGNVSIGDNFTLRPGASSILNNIATAGDALGSLTFNGALTLEGGATTSIPQVSLSLQSSANLTDISIVSNILAFDGIAPTGSDFYDYLKINGDFAMDDGTYIEIALANGYDLQLGQVFNLIDWTGNLNLDANGDSVLFDSSYLLLPDITALGLTWGTEYFDTHGIIYTKEFIVPEPGRAVLILMGLWVAILMRRRSN